MKYYDIIIIGGGAIGCAVSYVLAQYNVSIALLERNPDVAMGTSGKNSAVIHAGFNNKPGSLMAKLCVEGNKSFEELCKVLDVPYKKCGKLVVASNDDDLEIVERVLSHGKINGCIGLSRMGRDEMRELEPNIGGVGAVFSSNTAIINPFIYTINLCEASIQNNVDIYMETEVVSICKEKGRFYLSTNKDDYCCETLINSAGIYSDKVSKMAGDPSYKIYPSRGEYFILDDSASALISRPIYPVPRSGVGGLGVHLTTTIGNNVLIGPSAEYIDDREGYETTQAMMKFLFTEAVKLLPALKRDMIIGAYTGIRPKLVAKGQGNFGDFVIKESNCVENLINLVGIESPGLTASIPIANMVAEIILKKKRIPKKANYKPYYISPVRFSELPPQEQDSLIKENPDYGEIVCRCKQITKAEILTAMRSPTGAHSIVSIKNRLGVTMGRCQGGYCTAKITNIIMNELTIHPDKISYRYPGDSPFQRRLK
jgi:glycerol-3-phosphate dehydrogenase